jgi:hypothetical protein
MYCCIGPFFVVPTAAAALVPVDQIFNAQTAPEALLPSSLPFLSLLVDRPRSSVELSSCSFTSAVDWWCGNAQSFPLVHAPRAKNRQGRLCFLEHSFACNLHFPLKWALQSSRSSLVDSLEGVIDPLTCRATRFCLCPCFCLCRCLCLFHAGASRRGFRDGRHVPDCGSVWTRPWYPYRGRGYGSCHNCCCCRGRCSYCCCCHGRCNYCRYCRPR